MYLAMTYDQWEAVCFAHGNDILNPDDHDVLIIDDSVINDYMKRLEDVLLNGTGDKTKPPIGLLSELAPIEQDNVCFKREPFDLDTYPPIQNYILKHQTDRCVTGRIKQPFRGRGG